MIISQIVDTKIDQNEIESKYLWSYTDRKMNRINLATLDIDISLTLFDGFYMVPYLALPNNQIFAFGLKTIGEFFHTQFIIDETSHIKKIEYPTNIAQGLTNLFTSCYYDDSIFYFKYRSSYYSFKAANFDTRYSISQDKWYSMCPLPVKSPISCIGFKQKILIISTDSETSGMLIYDIVLDSYSNSFPTNNFIQKYTKHMFKSQGVCYLIIYDKCYATEDPFSEWTLVFNSEDILINWRISAKVLYEESIHCLTDCSVLYKFNLRDFKSETVRDFKSMLKSLKDSKIVSIFRNSSA